MFGTLVNLVHESAYRNPAREQHFGYMPPGLALPAAGRRSHEDGFHHGYPPLFLCIRNWYRSVPFALNIWYCMVPSQGEDDGDKKDRKTASGGGRGNPRPPAHPGGGVFGVHGTWLCRNIDARDRDPCARLEARTLR